MADHYIEAVKGIARGGLDSQLSLKLTPMGLDIDWNLCIQHMRRILDIAKQHDVFITINMEGESHCEERLMFLKS